MLVESVLVKFQTLWPGDCLTLPGAKACGINSMRRTWAMFFGKDLCCSLADTDKSMTRMASELVFAICKPQSGKRA